MFTTEQLIDMRDNKFPGDPNQDLLRKLIMHHIDANNVIAQKEAQLGVLRQQLMVGRGHIRAIKWIVDAAEADVNDGEVSWPPVDLLDKLTPEGGGADENNL